MKSSQINSIESFEYQKLSEPGEKHLTYNQIRQKNKNSLIKSIIILLKSTIGLGFLSIPIHFNNTGYLLSTVVIVFIFIDLYITSVMLIRIADSIEKKNPDIQLDTMDELFLNISYNKFVNKLLFWIIKVSLYFDLKRLR